MRGINLLAMLLSAALCAALAAPSRGQGALEDLWTDVRTSPPTVPADSPPPPQKRSQSNDCDDDCDDGWSGELVLGLACLTGITLTAPFWGPPVMIGDSYTEPGFFPRCPYEYGPGYMLIAPGEAFGLEGHRQPWTWAARTRAEYGTDFESLDWIGGHVLLEGMHRWGIETDFRFVQEDLTPLVQDELWLGDANVLFRFAQSPSLQMRTGLGVNFLADDFGSDFGFNFTYGGDWYPVQPLVFSGEFDIGTLGSANVYHLRATGGAAIGAIEAYVGYDYYDIGPTQVAGLIAGVRLWY